MKKGNLNDAQSAERFVPRQKNCISIKELQKQKGFENVTEDEALMVLETLEIFADILAQLYLTFGKH